MGFLVRKYILTRYLCEALCRVHKSNACGFIGSFYLTLQACVFSADCLEKCDL